MYAQAINIYERKPLGSIEPVLTVDSRTMEKEKKEPYKATFNDSMKEMLKYVTQNLSIEILGGVKLSGLDRMRVTLKITPIKDQELIPLRYPLDLYNADAVEKLIRRLAEQFQLELKDVRSAVMGLIDELEKYRLAELKKSEDHKPQVKVLTEQEREQVEDYMRSAKLMHRISPDIGRSGIVGNEKNRMIMFLAYTSRLLDQPLSLLTLGQSGSGKTYLQEKVALLIPEEHKIEITSLSKNAMYYYGQDDLNRKLILLEDLTGASPDAMYSIRELQSKHQLTKTFPERDQFGNTKTKTVVVKAKVSISATTTHNEVYEDNSNRALLLFPESSPEMDNEVMNYQLAKKAGLIDVQEEQRIQTLFQNIQRALAEKSVKVINPYAPLLKLPASIYTPRRAMTIYLGLIEAITFIHCFQRPTKNGIIETTISDIEWANKLISEVFIRKSDDLGSASRNTLEAVKKYMGERKKETFHSKDIKTGLRINPSSLKNYLREWIACDYVRIMEGSNKYRGNEYRLISNEEYSQMKQSVEDTLNTQLKALSKGKHSRQVDKGRQK